MIEEARQGALALWRVVIPVDCPGCGLPDVRLCPECRAALFDPGVRSVLPRVPVGCPVWAGCEYGGRTADLIARYKDHGRFDLAPVLSAAVGRVLTVAVPGRCVVVPIPSRRAAVRARGADVVAEVCRRLPAERFRIATALRVRSSVADQAGLSSAARAANLAGAFRADPRRLPPGLPVVLVDDVVTTGATLASAAAALTAAGRCPSAAVCIATTPKKGDSGDNTPMVHFAPGRGELP